MTHSLLLQYQDIVVSVARKTDAAMWPALFLAVGVPSELLDSLVDAGALTSAACCLLIVDRIEGSAAAHSSALRLIKVGLAVTSRNPVEVALRVAVAPRLLELRHTSSNQRAKRKMVRL